MIEDYEAWLHKTAGMMIGFNHADFEDLVQEGRIAIWQHPDWPTQRAFRRMQDVRQGKPWTGQPDRRNGGHGQTVVGMFAGLSEPLSDEQGQVAMPVLPDPFPEVRAAVRKLPPRQREYTYRRFWLDQKGAVIDEAMNLKSAQGNWRRARETLREELAA